MGFETAIGEERGFGNGFVLLLELEFGGKSG